VTTSFTHRRHPARSPQAARNAFRQQFRLEFVPPAHDRRRGRSQASTSPVSATRPSGQVRIQARQLPGDSWRRRSSRRGSRRVISAPTALPAWFGYSRGDHAAAHGAASRVVAIVHSGRAAPSCRLAHRRHRNGVDEVHRLGRLDWALAVAHQRDQLRRRTERAGRSTTTAFTASPSAEVRTPTTARGDQG